MIKLKRLSTGIRRTALAIDINNGLNKLQSNVVRNWRSGRSPVLSAVWRGCNVSGK